jgi:hypothetical protein
VEDPKTHRRIPTCNRTLTIPVFDAPDYRQVLSPAEEEAKAIYIETNFVPVMFINRFMNTPCGVIHHLTPYNIKTYAHFGEWRIRTFEG